VEETKGPGRTWNELEGWKGTGTGKEGGQGKKWEKRKGRIP